jgi:hypothetical protein
MSLFPCRRYKIVELKVSKDKTASCVFYSIENKPLLLERLVWSAVVNNKKEDSFLFSNHKNAHIFSDGADRGGGDLISMKRYMNRVDGNSGHYSIPSGVAENAAEDADNLGKTIYSKGEAELSQLMIDQKLHMFQLDNKNRGAVSGHEENGKDTRCILVEFVPPKDAQGTGLFHPNNLSVVPRVSASDLVIEEDEEDKDTFRECVGDYTVSEGRTHEVDKIQLQPEMVESREGVSYDVLLEVQMVKMVKSEDVNAAKTSKEGKIDSGKKIHFSYFVRLTNISPCKSTIIITKAKSLYYVGCVVKSNSGEKLLAFRFDEAMVCGEQSIDPSCGKVLCFPAEDGKMYATAYGLGTCGVTYSCPRCIRRHDSQAFPAWVQEFSHLLEPDSLVQDFELRKGEKSIKKSHQLFERKMGPNRHLYIAEKDLPKEVINSTYSSCWSYFRSDDPDSIPGDALHVSQGLMTHLNLEMVGMLRGISGDGWASAQKADLIKEAETLVRIKTTTEYLNARRMFTSYQTKINNCEKALDEEHQKRVKNQARIEKLTADIESHVSERDMHVTISKYAEMTAKVKGANEFLKLMKDNDKKDKKETLEHAEFLFLNCIRQYAGYFNKEHGGMELTNARGIQALEHRQNIHQQVCEQAHAANLVMNAKVKEVMDWWLMMADILYDISLTMKSQKKTIGDRLYQLKCNVVKYGVAWRKKITWKKPVFWKMHILECCVVPFADKHGMCGRGSTEGFENKHHEMSKLKAMLAPMANTGQRVQKLSQRQQMHLLPGLESLFEKIRNAKKIYGKRGPYKKSSGRARHEEDAPIFHHQDESDDVPVGCFKTELGILPIGFAEFYNFYKRDLAPNEWIEGIEKAESLGSKAKAEMRYF